MVFLHSVSTLVHTFNHASDRFDGAYPALTSKDFAMIPSHEDLHASSRKEFILASVFLSSKLASAASICENTIYYNCKIQNLKWSKKMQLP